VLSCHAAQAETRLSFAGLGDLLAPVEASFFSTLPAPQLRGLEVALLRADADGPAADPRTIGTGVVSLITALAARSPVLVAIDDAQWLDRPTAHALEFALRRLEGQQVAVLATVRVGDSATASADGLSAAVPADRLRRARLGPLSLGALFEIVKGQLGEVLTRPLLGSIERVSRGNPFYAMELARALHADGTPVSGERLPVPEDTRQLVARRIRRLPADTRDELVRASAMSRPTVALVDSSRLGPAVDAGIVVVNPDGRIDFAHPLFGGAVYSGATRDQRRRVHLELAGRLTDPEEQARHLALTSDEPDQRIADLLDLAAGSAYARGACEVAAELLEQAAQRTPFEAAELGTERRLRAARHQLKAGNRARSKALGEAVIASDPPSVIRARALHLLAEIAVVEHAPSAVPMLEEAIKLAGDDRVLAANIELSLGFVLGAPLGDPTGADAHLARALELAEAAGDDALVAEVSNFWTISRFLSGHGVDEAELERTLALEDPDREVQFQLRPSLNVGMVYMYLGKFELGRPLLLALEARIVARGEDSDLPYVQVTLGGTAWLSGDLAEAERIGDEAIRVAQLTGQDLLVAFGLFIRAMGRGFGGRLEPARADAAESLAISERIGWYHGIGQARWALAFLALSEGDPQAALPWLEPVIAAVEAMNVFEWPLAMSIPDAIEALVATGDLEAAGRLTGKLGDWGVRFDRPWALALSARSRALLLAATGELDAAQAAAEQALVEGERLPMPMERGRTLLVLGQLQRRRGERRAARVSLGQALEVFERVGSPLWAEKARVEARRIGVRRAPADLTENERLVAELAAAGSTNKEIAAQLFLSRRTVEANLARAYAKLGIRARAELGAAMSRHGGTPPN
jgi:DNA-binding CsgD family transcriptional regulator